MPARERKSINVEIGSKIREQRKRHGWTREHFAALTGYSLSFIQEIERGRSGLSSESMKRIAEALGISSDFLLGVELNNQSQTDSIAKKLHCLDSKKLSSLETIIDAYIHAVND